MTHDQIEKFELNNAKLDLLNTEIVGTKGIVSDLQHSLEEAEREYIELQRLHDQFKGQIETHIQHRAAMSRTFEKDLPTLIFESKMRCYGPALPSIDLADIVSCPVDSQPSTKENTPRVSFNIPNFDKERKNDAVLYLPPFFSHNGGYKMCLVVYCNGYRQLRGKRLIVLVSVLKGKYDDLLDWPLNCTVTIEIKRLYDPGSSMQPSIEVKSQYIAFTRITII